MQPHESFKAIDTASIYCDLLLALSLLKQLINLFIYYYFYGGDLRKCI